MESQEFKLLRKAMGLKGYELADRLGIDRGTITKYEKGLRHIPEPTARLLKRIHRDFKEYQLGDVYPLYSPPGQFHYNMAHWIYLSNSDIDNLKNPTWDAYYEDAPQGIRKYKKGDVKKALRIFKKNLK